MPQIEISDRLFREIQKHAVPLVDDIESTLIRILSDYASSQQEQLNQTGPTRYDVRMPPVLLHTTVLSAKVNGTLLSRTETYWNNIYLSAIKSVAVSGISAATVADCVTSNKHVGRRTDNGFRFIEEANLSLQGVDSNRAWSSIYNFCMMTGVGVDVTFRWQNKEGVERPNETGRLTIEPDPKKVSDLKRIDEARV